MTATQTEIQSQVIGLSTEAFEAFCEDISGMFGVNMKCTQQQICTETIEGLKKHFQELAAVTLINAKGALSGTFQLFLDKQGLFILGNLMIMPERMASMIEKYAGAQKIENNIKSGSLKEAKEISDAVEEAGNIMVGSWDRVFREGLDKHEHFKQINTFIGNPWDNPDEDVGLAPDEELLFVLYKMTAGSYPAFTCGAIFPKAVFSDAETEAKIRAEAREKVLAEAGEKARAEAEEKAKAETEKKLSEDDMKARIEAEEKAKVEAEVKARTETREKADIESEITLNAKTKEIPHHQSTDENNITQEENAEKQVPETPSEQTGPDTGEKPNVSDAEEAEQAGKAPTASKAHAEKAVETDKTVSVEEQKPAEQNCKLKKPVIHMKIPQIPSLKQLLSRKVMMLIQRLMMGLLKKKTTTTAEPESKEPAVSEFIPKIIKSPAVLQGKSIHIPLAICAQDIMQKEVVWGSGDDSVQLALTKMQQAETGYMLVGTDEQLEGIVSKSDITGAVSIYLRPIFAKWHKPIDDATLQIRIKWLMTKPVHTIRPETSLAQIMNNICQFGVRALPVVSQQGKVQGLVTVFDIYQAVLNRNSNISYIGKTRQMPLLAQLGLPVGREA